MVPGNLHKESRISGQVVASSIPLWKFLFGFCWLLRFFSNNFHFLDYHWNSTKWNIHVFVMVAPSLRINCNNFLWKYSMCLNKLWQLKAVSLCNIYLFSPPFVWRIIIHCWPFSFCAVNYKKTIHFHFEIDEVYIWLNVPNVCVILGEF